MQVVNSPPPLSGEGWYIVVCDEYQPLAALTKKVRYELRTGLDRCRVERVTADWLSEQAYECYRSGCARHRVAKPLTKGIFGERIRSNSTGPFEYWAVFAGNKLAGYSINVVDGQWVDHSSAMYDPGLLKERSAYVMVRALIDEYAGRRGLTLTNGMRTVLHDTNYNYLLLKLGFRFQYCELKLTCRPSLTFAVKFAYPLRRVLSSLPNVQLVRSARALLFMEGIRRSQADLENK